jgi:hypothetical protein
MWHSTQHQVGILPEYFFRNYGLLGSEVYPSFDQETKLALVKRLSDITLYTDAE